MEESETKIKGNKQILYKMLELVSHVAGINLLRQPHLAIPIPCPYLALHTERKKEKKKTYSTIKKKYL